MFDREKLNKIFFNVVNFPYRDGEAISSSVQQCITNNSLILSAACTIATSGQGSGVAIAAASGGYVAGHFLIGLAFRPFIR